MTNSKRTCSALNAQERQAAQQQILRDLLALGKKNGRLTLKEISDALSHLELSSEDIDKVYETLETMGIEVETERRAGEGVIGDDDDVSFEPEDGRRRFRRKNWSIPLPWRRRSPLTIRSACTSRRSARSTC